jgi:four helix bundle protein
MRWFEGQRLGGGVSRPGAIVGHARFQTHPAWQRGHALAISIHRLARGFTRAGHAHLGSQLTRAAESIPDNIVEGCGASTNKDFAKFLDSSIKSANETEGHLLKAKDLGLISRRDWQSHTQETIEVRKMTFGYRKKVLMSDTGDAK